MKKKIVTLIMSMILAVTFTACGSSSDNTESKKDNGKEKITGAGSHPAEWVAKYTAQKYGRPLCSICAEKAKLSADPLANVESTAVSSEAPPDPLKGEVELL